MHTMQIGAWADSNDDTSPTDKAYAAAVGAWLKPMGPAGNSADALPVVVNVWHYWVGLRLKTAYAAAPFAKAA